MAQSESCAAPSLNNHCVCTLEKGGRNGEDRVRLEDSGQSWISSSLLTRTTQTKKNHCGRGIPSPKGRNNKQIKPFSVLIQTFYK